MTTNQLFLEATDHFYKNQYQEGLQKITACLQSYPTNPTLLANRALFFSQMGHLQKAIQQLQACIRIDYQNYIPYFNLFSLKVRTNQLEEALKELCCSLSCLYLTRARFRKREQDAREAIKYAKNNVEAHVLRAMMLLQSKKLKDCMNQLEWAYQLQQNNATLNRIRAIVSKKLGISLKPQPSDPVPLPSQIQRLNCSYQPQQPDILMQIKMKMTQFNSIYNDLNQQNGIVTHRVPRTLLPQEIQKLLHSDSQLKQEIQELYELKYNAEDVNEPVIYQMKEEYRVQNQLEFEEQMREDQQDEDPFAGSDHNELEDDSLIDRIDEQDQREISKIAEHSKEQIDAQNNINEAHNTQSQQPSELSQGSFNQYLVVDQYPQLPQPQQLQQSHSQIHPQQSFSAITQEKSTYTQQHVGESSVSSLGTQEVIKLYPMLKKTYGRFKVDRLGITEERYIKEFLQRENAGEMYCVATYHKEKPGYKVTTCDRQLYFNQFERTVECEWGETFKEVLLINQPAQLMVKIYAKNNNSYNDDLIGVGCHQIKENGDIMVRITKPNDNEGQALGELRVKLFLVQK